MRVDANLQLPESEQVRGYALKLEASGPWVVRVFGDRPTVGERVTAEWTAPDGERRTAVVVVTELLPADIGEGHHCLFF